MTSGTERASLSDFSRLISVAVFGFLVPAFVYDQPVTGAAIPLSLVAVYSGVRFGWLIFAKVPELLRGFAWLFLYVFIGLAGITQYDLKSWPLPGSPADPLVAETSWLFLAFFVAVDIGGYIAHKRQDAPRAPRRILAPSRIGLIALFGLAAAAYELRRIGGPGLLLTSRDTLSRAMLGPTGGGALGPVHFALLGLPLFIAAYFVITARRQGLVHGWFLTSIVLTVGALVLTNPITSSRYSLGTVAVGLILAIVLPLSRRVYRALMLGALVGFLFAFRVLNEFRFDSRVNRVGVNLDLRSQLVEGDYDAFQQTANIIHVTHVGGLHPLQLVGPPLFWVPRSVWPGKPLDTGVLVGQSLGFDFVNLSAPLPGELFIAGGLLAVAIGGVALGYLWARLDAHLVHHGPIGFLGLLTPILAVYQFILLRGSLLQAMGSFAVIAVLLLAGTKRAPSALGEADWESPGVVDAVRNASPAPRRA